jgi:conjugal transfer pilus assembly protein TraK
MRCIHSRARCALIIPLAAATLLGSSAPAFADQFKQVADGGAIDCAVSRHELTRFSLVGDQFASVSKLSTGFPYNDFAVSNEPVRGDIYVSVPETYAAKSISFFATTKKGFVYKVACSADAVEAQQVFIANPAIAKDDAASWERETPLEDSAVRLIQGMAAGAPLPGYAIRQVAAPPARAGDLEIQLVAEHGGAALAGTTVRLVNRGGKPLTLTTAELAPRGALAVAILQPTLLPGQATTAWLVGANGEASHD